MSIAPTQGCSQLFSIVHEPKWGAIPVPAQAHMHICMHVKIQVLRTLQCYCGNSTHVIQALWPRINSNHAGSQRWVWIQLLVVPHTKYQLRPHSLPRVWYSLVHDKYGKKLAILILTQLMLQCRVRLYVYLLKPVKLHLSQAYLI